MNVPNMVLTQKQSFLLLITTKNTYYKDIITQMVTPYSLVEGDYFIIEF